MPAVRDFPAELCSLGPAWPGLSRTRGQVTGSSVSLPSQPVRPLAGPLADRICGLRWPLEGWPERPREGWAEDPIWASLCTFSIPPTIVSECCHIYLWSSKM